MHREAAVSAPGPSKVRGSAVRPRRPAEVLARSIRPGTSPPGRWTCIVGPNGAGKTNAGSRSIRAPAAAPWATVKFMGPRAGRVAAARTSRARWPGHGTERDRRPKTCWRATWSCWGRPAAPALGWARASAEDTAAVGSRDAGDGNGWDWADAVRSAACPARAPARAAVAGAACRRRSPDGRARWPTSTAAHKADWLHTCAHMWRAGPCNSDQRVCTEITMGAGTPTRWW
jgi:hypothetical protein